MQVACRLLAAWGEMSPELRKVARAARKAALAREQFHAAIREATRTHSLAEVAAVAGMTRQRVHQIARRV